MKLGMILLATLVAGVGSVWVAASLIRLGVGRIGSVVQGHHLLSFAAGALLATAFVHLLPEAMASHGNPQTLFAVLLAGLVAFFLLDKAELWHHGHEHALPDAADIAAASGQHAHAGEQASGSHDGHAHAHHHHHRHAGAWAVLAGDSVHCFGDGLLIASAFLVDWRLGVLAALSVLAHEVPHHIGDLIILTFHSQGVMAQRRKVALTKVSIAGAVTMLGGLTGYLLLALVDERWMPFFLVVASSSFIYVALADLIPQLQLKLNARQTVVQVAWLLAGMALVAVVSVLLHGSHDHAHGHDGHADHAPHQDAELGSFRRHPLHIEQLRPQQGANPQR